VIVISGRLSSSADKTVAGGGGLGLGLLSAGIKCRSAKTLPAQEGASSGWKTPALQLLFTQHHDRKHHLISFHHLISRAAVKGAINYYIVSPNTRNNSKIDFDSSGAR